jgi:uncharacterized protein (TIGR02268 family)
VVLVSLAGPVAWGQAAAPPVREVKARRVELPQLPSGEVLEVRVAPGFLTTLEFDSPLAREALTVDGRESRFALLELNSHTLVLRPAVALAPGERLLLTVRFADGLAPSRAVFALVAHPFEVDGQLQVVRRPLSNQALQSRLEAVLARCEAGGLAKLVLSGALGDTGVTAGMLTARIRLSGLEQGPSFKPRAYRSWKSFVATLLLLVPAGSLPWAPGEAWLLDAAGQRVRRISVWMDMSRLEPGQSAVIAVEVELHLEDVGKRFSLEVRERDGERGVLIEKVEL